MKFIATAIIIFAYIVTASIGLILPKRFRLRYALRVTQFYSRILLFILGVKVQYKCLSKLSSKNSLIVSNHMSYLDILIITALRPSIFITSHDVRTTPFIGFMSILGGSVFVNRHSIKGLRKSIVEIGKLLSTGFTVALFPEATSTNGKNILPFKSALFNPAILTRTPVQPICLKYTFIDGQPFDNNRDIVCFYGDMTFFDHLSKLLKSKRIEVKVTILDALSSVETDHGEMAMQCFKSIDDLFRDSSNV